MNLMSMDTNEVKTMSSLEIAELTGKQHRNVMADIRKMLTELCGEGGIPCFRDTYTNSQNNQVYKCFNLPEDLYNVLLDRYKGINRVPHRLREESSLKTIEQMLGVTLIRQYRVLNYRIDGYDAENNVAYEIDEEGHKYSKEKDMNREEIIKSILGCTFTRIKL